MINKGICLLVSLLLSTSGLFAQSAASPYSIYGIGVMSGYSLAYHQNMGGLGISNGKPWVLNNINPALLSQNNFSTFDAGMYVERRDLRTTDLGQSNTTGGLNYLAFAVPMAANKWTMAFGLMPYSNVSYNITTTAPLENRNQATGYYQYKGNGGINQVFMSSGWQIIPDLLYVGGRIAYAFGTVTDNTTVDISEIGFINENDTIGIVKTFSTSQYERSKRYSDFILQGGVDLRKKIGKKLEVNLGLVYDFNANLNTKRNEKLVIVEDGNPNPPTDVVVEEQKGNTFIPQKFGYGLSLKKTYKWTLGIDYYQRDWTKFKTDLGSNQSLVKEKEFIVGGEFTPDFFSVTSYLKRVTYQFGFNYKQTPIMINNTNIDDFGINFGLSLPVGNASLMNVGFKFGQRGTTTEGLIKENYVRFNLGMTFNDRSFGWYRNQGKFK